MDLLIYVSFLGHSRCKENGPFVRNTIYKFQPCTYYIIYKIYCLR